MKMKLKNWLIVLFIPGLIIPFFSFAQEDFNGANGINQQIGETVKNNLWGEVKKIFNEEVLPIWQRMGDWVGNNIWPRIENCLGKIHPLIKQEIEKRKPVVEEEFQKEKNELKEEAPVVGKSLWEKFKELIK